MAAVFQAVNTPVATVTTSLALVAPVIVGGDVMFAIIHSNNNTAPTIASGWTTISSSNNTSAQQAYLAWRRCSDADSGATFTWTVAGTTVSFGALVTYRNATRGGSTGLPYFTSSVHPTAVAEDNINYDTITPKNPDALIVAFGLYGLAATTAGAFSGTNPTMTNRLDAETASGIGASLFIHDGPSLDGSATGARTCASASTVDAISVGIVVDVLTLELPGVQTSYKPAFPAIVRTRGGRRG